MATLKQNKVPKLLDEAKKKGTVTIIGNPAEEYRRKVVTVYFRDGEAVKVNRSMYAESAVPNCLNHMQHNRYLSQYAEVFDERTGKVHATIIRSPATNTITSIIDGVVKEGW